MMWFKLMTWARIQKRMLWLYFFDFLVAIETPLMFVVNWILFLTTPLWIGFLYLLFAIGQGISERRSKERAAMTGQIWFWEQFRVK